MNDDMPQTNAFSLAQYERNRSYLLQRALNKDLGAYLNLVVLYRSENPDQRKGQAHFNVLAAIDPKLADQIRGTQIDPFHRDCVLADFLSHIALSWEVSK